MIVQDANGNYYDDGEPLRFTVTKQPWVDETPSVLQNPDSPPADIAAYRTSRAVKRANSLPVADDRGSPFSGPADPARPSYIMEPSLEEAQGGMHLPSGLMQEDSGRLYYDDAPDKTVPMVRRPNLVPVTYTPEGLKFVVPKALDIVGNVMGNVGGKVLAKPGEMVLGSGVVRTEDKAKKLMKKWDAEGVRNYVAEQSDAVGGHLKLHDLVVPKEKRGEGIGTKFMEDLIKLADEEGKTIVLTAAKDYGATSVNRLKDFYKRFGFIENKGRNKDFRISDNMYREPTLLSDTRNQVASQVAHQVEKNGFYSAFETAVNNSKVEKADAQQWTNYLRNQPGVKQEELQYVLGSMPEGQLSKTQVQDLVKQNKVELRETTLGEMKINEKSKYYSPEVKRAIKEAGSNPGELELTLANDGDAYRVLTKKFPELIEDEDWAAKVAKDVYGGNTKPKGTTKYHAYQLPGGENYKEMLLSLPSRDESAYQLIAKNNGDLTGLQTRFKNRDEAREYYQKLPLEKRYTSEIGPVNREADYKSPHFDEHGTNLLTHIRMNDRNIEGKKALHIEEIQSDWHQKGRKEGYKQKDIEQLKAYGNYVDKILEDANAEHIMGNPDLKAGLDQAVKEKILLQHEADEYMRLVKNERSTIPDAPFKKNWDELALKRMIRKASEEGYDAVSWTPGEAQAARYDLSKQVERIHWDPQHETLGKDSIVRIYPKNGDPINLQYNNKGEVVASFPTSQTGQFEGKNLADVIGKETAEKILSKKKGNLEGLDLKIGGEGMKAFYDKMLVDRANNLAKKYGSKVEQKLLALADEKYKGKYLELLKDVGHTKEEWEVMTKIERANAMIKAGVGQPIHYLSLTKELKKKALEEGFPLFSSSPVLSPVTYQPDFGKDKKPKLVPVSHIPVFE